MAPQLVELGTGRTDMGGSTQTFDWIFFAIVCPLPFIAAMEMVKTHFFAGTHDAPHGGR